MLVAGNQSRTKFAAWPSVQEEFPVYVIVTHDYNCSGAFVGPGGQFLKLSYCTGTRNTSNTAERL